MSIGLRTDYYNFTAADMVGKALLELKIKNPDIKDFSEIWFIVKRKLKSWRPEFTPGQVDVYRVEILRILTNKSAIVNIQRKNSNENERRI